MADTDDIPKPELLPCPFCGNPNVRIMSAWQINESDKNGYAICCSVREDGCGVTGGYRIETTAVVDQWNRRA